MGGMGGGKSVLVVEIGVVQVLRVNDFPLFPSAFVFQARNLIKSNIRKETQNRLTSEKRKKHSFPLIM